MNASKHLYQCSQGKFKIMPLYQINDYMLLQIKEMNFIDKFKPKLNKTWIHTHTHTHTNEKHTHTHKKNKILTHSQRDNY